MEIVMDELKNNYSVMAREIIYCGIGMDESVLHFGACDNDLNFIETVDQLDLDIQYTAVDVKESVQTLFTDYQPSQKTYPWITVNVPMQEFIDDIGDQRYNWTILTGVFDKPLYSERQYQFLDTVISSCFDFSDNVLFTIKEEPIFNNENSMEPYFQSSVLYLFSQIIGVYPKATIKKVEEGRYIFCISRF